MWFVVSLKQYYCLLGADVRGRWVWFIDQITNSVVVNSINYYLFLYLNLIIN